MRPFSTIRKALFFFLIGTSAALLLSIDQSVGADSMVVAVDSSLLLKAIGMVAVALLAEIWRNQRALFKITNAHGEEIKEIKGFCRGKNESCGDET